MIMIIIIVSVLINFMPNKSVFAAGAADSDPGTSLGTGTGTGTTTSGQNSTSISDAIAAGVTREDIEATIKTATGKSDEEVRKIYNAATNDTTKIVINFTKLYTGGITNVSADVKFTDDELQQIKDGTYQTNLGTAQTPTDDDSEEEEGGEDDIGGILFRPIASLICGIGDTCNTLLQRLLIGEKSDAFISRRIFFEF